MNSARIVLQRARVPLTLRNFILPKNLPQRSICTSVVRRGPFDHEPYHDEGYSPFTFRGDNYIRRLIKFFLFMASGFWYPFFVYDHHRMRYIQG